MLTFIGGKPHRIAVVENIIPKEVCVGIINECKYHYDKLFYPGPTIGGVQADIKASMDFDFGHKDIAEKGIPAEPFMNYEDKITQALYGALALYVEQIYELNALCPQLIDTGYRLQNYKQRTNFYRRHYDGAPWNSGSLNQRVLGVVMYLNTIDVGGGTGFPEHDIVIPAKQGSIAIFPASWTHPHMGMVPISDEKWMISTFMYANRLEDIPAAPPQTIEPTIIKF